jgi:hypothetical protein
MVLLPTVFQLKVKPEKSKPNNSSKQYLNMQAKAPN